MNCIRCGVAGLMLWIAVPFVSPPIANLALVPWQDWALLFVGCALGIALGATLYLSSIREIGVSRPMALPVPCQNKSAHPASRSQPHLGACQIEFTRSSWCNTDGDSFAQN